MVFAGEGGVQVGLAGSDGEGVVVDRPGFRLEVLDARRQGGELALERPLRLTVGARERQRSGLPTVGRNLAREGPVDLGIMLLREVRQDSDER